MLTEAQLRTIMPLAGARLTPHLPYIGPAMEWGKITQPKNVCAFVAHLAHESGEYRYMREIADGSDYEGRGDLGNVYPGDGIRYPGRGGIQVTGRAAARACGKFFGQPFEQFPELMEKPEWATHVSVWFWAEYKTMRSTRFQVTTKILPVFAQMDWFLKTTNVVNGGTNGLEDRIKYWNRARALFHLPILDIGNERSRIKMFQESVGLFADGDAGGDTAARAAEWLECQR